MQLELFTPLDLSSLEPVSNSMPLADVPVGGEKLHRQLQKRYQSTLTSLPKSTTIQASLALWPSDELLSEICRLEGSVQIQNEESPLLTITIDGNENFTELSLDENSTHIKYPWDLLEINSQLIAQLENNTIEGEIRPNVYIDGNVKIGKGTVLLPGVYIEGNAIIGENCKIGPNCYIRGNTYIGNKCHVGQAVEIKNSLLMDHVSAGHLSYLGDSIVCQDTNFGAGTITANLRHDGRNMPSKVEGKWVDTGRRKLGTIVGANVHTGIHTSIYPGRKIWPGQSTLPGTVVSEDLL